MDNKACYTKEEADALVEQLSKTFSVVRILKEKQVAGIEKIPGPKLCACFEFWGKTQVCTNCISYKTLHDKEDRLKFEYLDGTAYQVISEYLNVDGENCVLEILKEIKRVTIDPQDVHLLSTKLTNLDKELYKEALTGCKNRAYYEDNKDIPLLSAGVIFIDIDGFKQVNDLYGHLFGDEVLKGVANIFMEVVGDKGNVIRYGGDEFIVVMPNVSEDELNETLTKIGEGVNELEFYVNPNYHVTVSAGVTIVKEKTLQEAVGITDKLMYQAKRKKNSVARGF